MMFGLLAKEKLRLMHVGKESEKKNLGLPDEYSFEN